MKQRLGWAFWLAVGWLVLVCGLAILAPVLPIADPGVDVASTLGAREAPSSEAFLGTDALARDVFSRTIWGARISLIVGFSAVALGLVVGGALGLMSGFFGGIFDTVVGFVFLVLLSFPSLILAILMTSLLDRTLLTISLVLGVLAIAPVGRIARGATIQFAERDFVTAAKALGATRRRILFGELLPNVLVPMAGLALLGMGIAIVAEGGLAFLDLSVSGDSITWGKLIADGAGRREIEAAPWVAFVPIVALFLTVLSLNFAGDKLREHFDVKESLI